MLKGLIIPLICLFLPLLGQSAGDNSHEIDKLWERGYLALSQGRYLEARDAGLGLLDYHSSPRSQLLGHIILGQAYLRLNNEEECYRHIRQAQQSDLELIPDSVKCTFYNGLGLYTVNLEKDNYKGLEYYFKGLEIAKKSHNRRLYALLLNNIVGVYFLQKDPSGLGYARECYQIAKESGDPVLLVAGSVMCTDMYMLNRDFKAALPIAQGLVTMVNSKPELKFHAEAYQALGEVYAGMNQYDKAIDCFNHALTYGDENESIAMRACLGRGRIHFQQGEYDLALSSLQRGLRISDQTNAQLFRKELIQAMSECHEKKGNLREALRLYQQYSQAQDSIYNSDREKILQETRARFDLERQENLLQAQALTLKNSRTWLISLVIIVIVVIAASIWLMMLYRRKNRLYRAIVQQNKQSIATEDELKRTIQNLRQSQGKPLSDADEPTDTKYAASSLSDEKAQSITRRMETLMIDERVYSDTLFTQEKLASLLQTNRSYLSQIINERYGMNFTQWVNNYRIQDAIRILSDPKCNTPLKAVCTEVGFSSMTTFYALFKKATGMTPSAYRSVVSKG